MPDHNINEYDQKEICPYCKSDISKKKDWKSHFCGDLHYKSTKCSCGKEINIKVHFQGSGHDTWSGAPSWMFDDSEEIKPPKPLDEVIEEHKHVLEDRREKDEETDNKRRKEDNEKD